MTTQSLTPERKALGAFCILPNSRYAHQAEGEEMLVMVRAHPITQIPWILNIFLAVLLYLVLLIVFASLIPVRMVVFFTLVTGVGLFAYGWYHFLLWYYNLGLITTDRIIDIDYYGVSKREFSEALLEKVADATGKSTGFFRQIFDYGDVFVHTEGATVQEIEFYNVPYPDRVVTILNNFIEKHTP